MKLLLQTCEVGIMPTNCYLVKDEESGQSLVVDPGYCNHLLLHAIQSMGISQLDYILLTHGHHDHILGLSELHARFGGSIVIHESEEAFLSDESLSLRRLFLSGPPQIKHADMLVHDGDTLPFADGVIRVMHTPGHTRGSVCYLLDRFLFSGDTLFYLSVGRTDLPTGNMQQMLQSCARLGALTGDYTVLPGHGPQSTLSYERSHNPYLFSKPRS